MTQAVTGTLGELEPFWMPFSPNKEFKKDPRLFVRAEGMYLYTPDGRALIDASAGLFCVAAGHCRPEIAEAVYRQLKTLDYAGGFLRAPPEAFQLAHSSIEYTPAGVNRVCFLTSGSGAVSSPMKKSCCYPRGCRAA